MAAGRDCTGEPAARPDRARRGRLLPRRAADVLDPDALPVALVILVVSCGYAGVVTYVNPYLLDGGLETAASLFFVVFAVGMLLVRLVTGHLQDRRPERLGIATSTHYLMLDTGIAFGPVLFGTLIPVPGYRGHYLVLSAVVAAGMALYWFVHGRHGRAAPP